MAAWPPTARARRSCATARCWRGTISSFRPGSTPGALRGGRAPPWSPDRGQVAPDRCRLVSGGRLAVRPPALIRPPVPAAPPRPPLAGGDALGDRLAEMTHDLLAAAGADRRLRWTNPAWQQALGWTAAELAADSYHGLVHADDLERVRAAERAVLAGRAGDRPETELRL